MKKIIIPLLLLLSIASLRAEQRELDTLLRVLDKTIIDKEVYTERKRVTIHSLKDRFYGEPDKEKRIGLAKDIALEYLSFKTDSAMVYIVKMGEIANSVKNRERFIESEIDRARILRMMGMLKEAYGLLNELEESGVPPQVVKQFLYCRLSVYNGLRDFAINSSDKAEYERVADKYRDSLLNNYDMPPMNKFFVRTEQLISHKETDKALGELLEQYSQYDYQSRNAGIIAHSIAMAYRDKGDLYREKVYFARSAIADLREGVKDYVSLRRLGTLMYDADEIDRAYAYMKCSMEDAIFCNARLRALETMDMFMIIDKSYQQKEKSRKEQLLIFLSVTALLSLMLLVTLLVIRRQNRRITKSKDDLAESNIALHAANLTLSDSNIIKEEYIGLYMEQCSNNLSEKKTLKTNIDRAIKRDSNIKAVERVVETYLNTENELLEFYSSFDATILHLFPNFASEFDSLLIPEARGVYTNISDGLSPELRIFALIRLGITDSVKIAKFLRYSLSTIYNYRTKIRNKALGDRDDFENRVMETGA